MKIFKLSPRFFFFSLLTCSSAESLAQNNYFDPGVHSDDIKPIETAPMSSMPTTQYSDPNTNYPQTQQDLERMERYNQAMEKLRQYTENGFTSQHQAPQYQNRVPPRATFNKRPSPTAPDFQDQKERQAEAFERMRAIYPGN